MDALQQECGELPLSLRRKRCILRFALKVAHNDSNPAQSVTEINWKSIYGRPYERDKEPIYTILNNFVQLDPEFR